MNRPTSRLLAAMHRGALAALVAGIPALTHAEWTAHRPGAGRGAPVTAAASLAEALELTAVVAHRRGTVTAAAPADPGPGAVLRSLQVVAAGTVVSLAPGAEAELVCSSDRVVLLLGPMRWSLTAPGCAEGRELPLGTYGELVPRAGRLASLAGALVFQPGMRGDAVESTRIPLLLAPRGAEVLEERPALRWRSVAGATGYELAITGLPRKVHVGLEEISCVADPGWDGEIVCSLPWPEEHPGLAPGESYEIVVASSTSPGHAALREEPPPWVRRLGEAETQELNSRRAAVATLPLGAETRMLLDATVLAGAGLTGEAVAAIRNTGNLGLAPEVEVALGDLYEALGLPSWAERAYRRVLDHDGRPAPRAAALFGLGRVHFQRWQFEEAAEAFHRAQSLFAGIGARAEAAEAEDAAAAAERRLPSSPSVTPGDDPPQGPPDPQVAAVSWAPHLG